AADDRERERIDVDHRARVLTRHEPRPLLVQPARLRIALDIATHGLGNVSALVENDGHLSILRLPTLLRVRPGGGGGAGVRSLDMLVPHPSLGTHRFPPASPGPAS